MVSSLRVPSNFFFWFLLTLALNARGCNLLVLSYCFILLITSLPQFPFEERMLDTHGRVEHAPLNYGSCA